MWLLHVVSEQNNNLLTIQNKFHTDWCKFCSNFSNSCFFFYKNRHCSIIFLHQFSLNFSIFVHNYILNHLEKHTVKFQNPIQSFHQFLKFLESWWDFGFSVWVDLWYWIVARVVRDQILSISVLELSSNTLNWVRYKHFSDFRDYFVVSGVLDTGFRTILLRRSKFRSS